MEGAPRLTVAAREPETVEEPRGGSTFVFTDIEGSTRLVRDLLSSYGLALRIHRRMLQTSFEQHGGKQIGSEGDALFFVFPSPARAVAGAVDAQQEIDNYEWPEGLRLRVRIGIHHGPVRVSGGEFVGLAVHEVSRICAAAHGGQILCSSAVARAFDESMEGVTLLDLGVYSLRGFPEPERLFQVCAPTLAEDFPPPRDAVRDGGVKVTIWQRESGSPVRADPADLRIVTIDGEPIGRLIQVEMRAASSGASGCFALIVRRDGAVEEEYDGLTVGGAADAAAIVNAHSRFIRVEPAPAD